MNWRRKLNRPKSYLVSYIFNGGSGAMQMDCFFSKPSYEHILEMQKIIVEKNDFDACCVYNLTELRRSKS